MVQDTDLKRKREKREGEKERKEGGFEYLFISRLMNILNLDGIL
jgi:hypothetical protein